MRNDIAVSRHVVSKAPRDAPPAVSPVIEVFEQWHVPYHIGGSFAVSSYGVPRASIEIDVLAELVTERPAG